MIRIYHNPNFNSLSLSMLNLRASDAPPLSTCEHVADVATDSLDVAYDLSQAGDRDWALKPGVTVIGRNRRRSTSVGDLMVDDSGTSWMVDKGGFLEVGRALMWEQEDASLWRADHPLDDSWWYSIESEDAEDPASTWEAKVIRQFDNDPEMLFQSSTNVEESKHFNSRQEAEQYCQAHADRITATLVPAPTEVRAEIDARIIT